MLKPGKGDTKIQVCTHWRARESGPFFHVTKQGKDADVVVASGRVGAGTCAGPLGHRATMMFQI